MSAAKGASPSEGEITTQPHAMPATRLRCTSDKARVHKASNRAPAVNAAHAARGRVLTHTRAKAASIPAHAQTVGRAAVVSSSAAAASDSAASRITGAGRRSRGLITRMEPSVSAVAANGAVRSMARPEAVLARQGSEMVGASTKSVISAKSSPTLELSGSATSASLWKAPA